MCVGLFEGEELPAPFADAPGAADAKSGYRKLEVLRPEGSARVAVVGLGRRDEFDPERARVAAALGTREAASYEARSIAWVPPAEGAAATVAAALVEGTILAAYRFDRYKSPAQDDEPPPRIETLTLLGGDELSAAAREARVAAEAENRARELQNLPSNVVTPSYLANRAGEIAAGDDRVSVEVLDREEIAGLEMGGIVAVSRGTHEEPRFIVLRYRGVAEGAETLALVGKAVTFDSGGISIKPASHMNEMKMDMSGGAAVIEAVAAIAELGLAVNVIAAIPATENMPSGHAIKPGDIITQHNGKTVEIINTDAEGRLILADALSWCREQGADRMIDLATLTGAVLTALGSTYAGLISNDDEWAERVRSAAEETGELAWRLPLHPEYKELTKGTVTELVNASEKRKAGPIYAASFLEEFVGEVPWVHLDIAGTAWDVGREYVGKGATGYGVRLLVALARGLSRYASAPGRR
ncbi:MAG TPA: leucyl aminopeptidase [Solirubrobacterales bacterium]|nr:leucyl aminopeptidase [Solirubrobacterales bacterium]